MKSKIKSLIGTTYVPVDNSYSCNLSKSLPNNYSNDPFVKDYLAGTNNTPSQVCTIISEPFKINLKWGTKEKEHEFVILEKDGEQHLQLYIKRD